jgi:hypothetical protein
VSQLQGRLFNIGFQDIGAKERRECLPIKEGCHLLNKLGTERRPTVRTQLDSDDFFNKLDVYPTSVVREACRPNQYRWIG